MDSISRHEQLLLVFQRIDILFSVVDRPVAKRLDWSYRPVDSDAAQVTQVLSHARSMVKVRGL